MPLRALLRSSVACVLLALLWACVHDAPVEVSSAELRPIVGPGDVLEVRVYGEKELSGPVRVDEKGEVRLPLIGALLVDGLTPDEIRVQVEDAYNAAYLKNAQVMVLVKEANSRKVYVLGQVKKPGAYPFEEKMTVIAAIARAGGTVRLADENRTLITREKDGAQERFTVAVADISRGRSPDVELRPGDIIFVPETLF